MQTKHSKLLRRRQRIRNVINKHCIVPIKTDTTNARHRLTIIKSGRHIYAQVIDMNDEGRIVCSASTLENRNKQFNKSYCNLSQAKHVGQKIGQLALDKGVSKISVDRSGYKYHGRIKTVVDSAREVAGKSIAF